MVHERKKMRIMIGQYFLGRTIEPWMGNFKKQRGNPEILYLKHCQVSHLILPAMGHEMISKTRAAALFLLYPSK